MTARSVPMGATTAPAAGRGRHRHCASGGRARAGQLVLLLAAPLATVGGTATVALAASGPSCSGAIAGVSIYAGSGQVAKVGTAYAAPLEAEVVDTGGCPVVDADVEFTAPAAGATGTFPGGAVSVAVPTGNDGVAQSPQFTANAVAGSFVVEAAINGFSADFELTNTEVGAVSTVTASGGSGQSAHIGDAFGEALQATVVDAYGDPVAGTTVNFVVNTTNGAGATFAGGGSAASAQTNQQGVAVSPALTAGSTTGAFTVTASVAGVQAPATFSLTDLAGSPDTLTAGVGSSQTTELGSDFPVPLAVTVEDADGNAVPGVPVTFSAPKSGASGVFAGAGAIAVVMTGSTGIATAPDFSANGHAGGYIVMAQVAGVATPATFALVNEPRQGASAPGPEGSYWLATSTGKVLTSGSARYFGSVPAKQLTSPVVAMAAMPDGLGYWLVTAKGTVYPFGSARTYGPSGVHFASPIVGVATTADGKGYWLVSSDGGVFAYGDARYFGSAAEHRLAKPVTGIAATPDGNGYWLVASDGGVFNYGDARFYGPTATRHLTKAIVGIASSADGKGYWLLEANGAVFGYGDAITLGSGAGLAPMPVRALVRTADGEGYWVVSANGTAAGFGDAGAQGSGVSSAKQVVTGAA